MSTNYITIGTYGHGDMQTCGNTDMGTCGYGNLVMILILLQICNYRDIQSYRNEDTWIWGGDMQTWGNGDKQTWGQISNDIDCDVNLIHWEMYEGLWTWGDNWACKLLEIWT